MSPCFEKSLRKKLRTLQKNLSKNGLPDFRQVQSKRYKFYFFWKGPHTHTPCQQFWMQLKASICVACLECRGLMLPFWGCYDSRQILLPLLVMTRMREWRWEHDQDDKPGPIWNRTLTPPKTPQKYKWFHHVSTPSPRFLWLNLCPQSRPVLLKQSKLRCLSFRD